jgi:hypothetical protein
MYFSSTVYVLKFICIQHFSILKINNYNFFFFWVSVELMWLFVLVRDINTSVVIDEL